MKLISNNFEKNGLFSEPDGTSSDQVINWPSQINNHFLKDVQYIRVLFDYGEPWTIDCDPFKYLKPESLNNLRDRKCIFVFDNSMEGWSPIECPVVIALHNSALKYQIDLRKIYYLTSNHLEYTCYANFLFLNNISVGINILQSTMISDMVLPREYEPSDHHQTKFLENHKDKFFLHLSRRNRPHRVLANYLMSKSEIKNDGYLSQDKLRRRDVNSILNVSNESPNLINKLTVDDIKEWNRELPYVVDSDDFEVNWASYRSEDLYHKTVFSIVLETNVNDRGGTTMFPSEKTFKAIIHKHPFMIFGNRGINSFLKSLGLKTYDSYFDIGSFDFETDPVSRYLKIKDISIHTVNHLKKLTIEQRCQWRFQFKDILDYNYDLLVSGILKKNEFEKLHQTIYSYFSNDFYNYLNTKISPN